MNLRDRYLATMPHAKLLRVAPPWACNTQQNRHPTQQPTQQPCNKRPQTPVNTGFGVQRPTQQPCNEAEKARNKPRNKPEIARNKT